MTYDEQQAAIHIAGRHLHDLWVDLDPRSAASLKLLRILNQLTELSSTELVEARKAELEQEAS